MDRLSIFVNYDHFYVNGVMFTQTTVMSQINIISRCRAQRMQRATICSFANIPSFAQHKVNVIYLIDKFVQVNNGVFFYF